MENFKSCFKLIIDFSLIIILGAIIFPRIKGDNFIFFGVFFVALVAICIIGIVKDYFKEITLKEKEKFEEAKKEFNKWYVEQLNKKEAKYCIGLQNLTPYEMFGEVVKNSETGKKILNLIREETKNGGKTKNFFASCENHNYNQF